MEIKFKEMMSSFLIKEFPIKRARNNLGRMSRVVIVDGGYIRQNSKKYKWGKGVDINLVFVDFVQILRDVFYCTNVEATEIVKEYFNKYKI